MPVVHGLTAMTALRIICGFFFIPHAIGKFTAKQAAFGFFAAAGFRPAALFASIAMVLEVGLALLLISGFYVVAAAWVSCAYLIIAALAVIKVEKKWLWHIGGCEYPVFWGLCCMVVAVFT